jgi:hypothetical protein
MKYSHCVWVDFVAFYSNLLKFMLKRLILSYLEFIVLSIYILFHLHNLFWYKYTMCIFLTTCFGLLGPSSGTFRMLYNHLLFDTLPPHRSVFTHWECVVCVHFVCLFLPGILFYVIIWVIWLKYNIYIL